MRILIDLQGCQSASRFGGIGRYSMSLAKAMLRLDSSHEIRLLLNSRLPNENFIRAEFAALMPQQHIHTFAVPAYVAADNNLPAHTRMAELIREKRIAEINPDVLHIASLFEGAGEDVVTSVGTLFPAARTAVTLYDLIPYLEQETYLTNQMLANHYLGKFAALRRAGMVVSISEFSRIEALAHTDIPREQIANISSAVDGQFAPLQMNANAKSDLLHKFGIEKHFLMFTGSFDVRKNHDRLVEAFARIPPALRAAYQLVIIGKGEARQISRLQSIGEKHGLKPKDLVFVGHVTDADLVALYNLCALFVFPSLREGFGLPVLEAMSCGAPSIGSNRTSIPEVIGRADALFDPENAEDIAAKITLVLSNASLHEDLRKHGLAQAKNFSWELSAKRALEFFGDRVSSVSLPMHTSSVQRGLESGLPPHDAGDGEASHAKQYDAFLAVLSDLKLERLDEEFLTATAHVIAANELLSRIECDEVQSVTRIGWVTQWDSDDAASANERTLIEALPVRPTIFAPYQGRVINGKPDDVIRCWNLGVGDDLVELNRLLEGSPLDVVVVQYANTSFRLSALANLVIQQKKLNRAVFVMLRSSEELRTITMETGMLDVKLALKSCDGIFVQSMLDVKTLEAFNVRRNVNFLPGSPTRTQLNIGNSDEVERNANQLMRKIAFAAACCR